MSVKYSSPATSNKSKKLKKSSVTIALLPLAACGGGGGGGGGGVNTPPPAPTPPAEFIENPTNVFIARDDRDTTLQQGDATNDLTVTGKGGDDVIHTGSGADTIAGGSGNDLIRAGEGLDTISAGDGNDAIVVIGTTTANQYDNADITNAGSSGTDLSSLITLANLNGRATSEVEAGETIDGGNGTNTLFIYGTVDLTGVTLNNLTILEVNSDVTLTAEQLAEFTTVDGDGNSVINIEIPPGSPDNFILDLDLINVSDIATINIDGNITIAISNESDIAGIGTISVGAGDQLNLDVNDGATIDLGNLGGTFNQIDSIDAGTGVTLVINDPDDIDNLGLTEITGNGQIETNGSSDVDDALDGVDLDPAINTKPISAVDAASVGENETSDIDVLSNDTDYDNDALSVTGVSGNNGEGSVSVTAGDDIRFTPGTDFDYLDDGESVQVVKTYNLSDGEATVPGTLTITVNGANDAPIAVNDIGGTSENQTIQFNVVTNDIDVDIEELTITNVSIGAGQGAVSIVNNKIEFNPGSDFEDLKAGEEEQVVVSYTVSDGDETDDGTLTITVTGVNDAPVATDDTDTAGENEIITTDVLANDTDIENDALSISNVSVGAGQGSVSVVGGQIQFDPGTDFDYLDDGDDAEVVVNYTVFDGDKSDDGTLTITVNGSNDAPEAVADADSVIADETISVDVLANDSDAEGDTITLTNVSGPGGKGSASIVGGEIFFDPGSDFDHLAPAEEEEVEITYTISAAGQDTNGTLTITVIGPNEAPVTVNDTASTGENETILVDVVANDTDADGHELTLTAVSVGAGEGSVSVVDGQVQFDPGYDFDPLLDGQSQDVEITYTVSDGIDETDGTLTVTVNGDTEEPIANADVAEVLEGGTVYIDVMDNDTDPEGGEIELISATSDDGTVTIENGHVKFTPNNSFESLGYGETGEATIKYEIQSDYGIAEGTVTVTVNGKNDDPVAVNDSASVNEGGSIIIDVLGNDSDPNGNDLYIYSVSSPDLLSNISAPPLGNVYIINGELVFDTAGDFNYLDFGKSAEVEVTYVVIDALGGTDIGRVNITINGTNDSYNPINTNFYLVDTNVYYPTTPAPGTFSDIYLNQNTAIFGWTFNDNITMGSGNDFVDGWDGGDDMDGGLGFDVLLYNESDAGVNVNLATGSASGGFASGDDFSNFEGIEGSAHNDTLTGDESGNSFYGHNGNDTINGAGGHDLVNGGAGNNNLNGGDGIDTLSYVLSTSGVNVNLATGATSGGHATGDTISNFEDVFGSAFNDVITGDENNNLIDGYGGIDTLNGAGGNDTFLAYEIDGAHLSIFDGGTGYDGILFFGSSTKTPYHIDLGNLNATNIEIIDLHQSVNFERLEFTAQDVIDITDAGNTLRIFGGANDAFQTSSEWTYVSDFTFGDVVYSTYTSGSATIEVSRAIPVDNMFLPVPGNFYHIPLSHWFATDDTNSIFNKPTSTDDLIIFGKNGNDTITSGSGNDFIDGADGYDTIFSGNGDDTIIAEVTDAVDGGAGTDTLVIEGDQIVLDLTQVNNFSNIEIFEISGDSNVIRGDASANTLISSKGGNTVEGMGGADTLIGIGNNGQTLSYEHSNAGVTVNLATNSTDGGDATGDIISGFHNVIGSAFDDTLTGSATTASDIDGGDGNNTIYASDFGGTIIAGNGNNIIYGGDYDDGIETGTGDDIIYGGASSDSIQAGLGNNTLFGGADHDSFMIIEGTDTVDGGDGVDRIDFFYATSAITVNLATNNHSGDAAAGDSYINIERIYATDYDDNLTGDDANNFLDGRKGNDTIFGGGGNDHLDGHDGNDILNGEDGNDILLGGDGINILDGGLGDDILYGGADHDTLTGGQGDDTFFRFLGDNVDGGAGHDILQMHSHTDAIDLSEENFQNIEEILMETDSNGREVVLTMQDLIDVTDGNNILTISGDESSTVNSTGQGWVQGADQVIDTETYHTYTAGGATLLVDTDIIQDIS